VLLYFWSNKLWAWKLYSSICEMRCSFSLPVKCIRFNPVSPIIQQCCIPPWRTTSKRVKQIPKGICYILITFIISRWPTETWYQLLAFKSLAQAGMPILVLQRRLLSKTNRTGQAGNFWKCGFQFLHIFFQPCCEAMMKCTSGPRERRLPECVSGDSLPNDSGS